MPQPNLRDPLQLFAFGFGSGLLPKAPGTAGSFAALFFFPLLLQIPLWAYALVIVVAVIAGGFICGHAAEKLGVHDDGRIVWDEFVGQWIALLPLPIWWQYGMPSHLFGYIFWVALSFALFRFFDVIKPWPISWLDEKIDGGFGIMVDDLVAGVFAALLLLFALSLTVFFKTPTLLS
jgi:phosphatidylglycerophosphatase A